MLSARLLQLLFQVALLSVLLPARRAIRKLANNKAVYQLQGHRFQLRFTSAGSRIWRHKESRSITNPLDQVQGSDNSRQAPLISGLLTSLCKPRPLAA